MNMNVPRDYPSTNRSHRIYVALTNHCNRSCPWCSMYSSPAGTKFLSEEKFCSIISQDSRFELQLEGGEPTVHPLFWRFVELGRDNSNCERIIICTNGTKIPRDKEKLRTWLARLGKPLTIKVSVNHYLIDNDPGLIDLCKLLVEEFPLEDKENILVLNVRLRKGIENDDLAVRQIIEKANLLAWSNMFFLQRYGLAKNQQSWGEPFAVADNFRLINPDGRDFGIDLFARSEAMEKLG